MSRHRGPLSRQLVRSNVFVVDASVAVQWYVPDGQEDAAERLLAPGLGLHVPDLFFSEVVSILRKKACLLKVPELTVAEGQVILRKLLELPLIAHPVAPLAEAVYELSSSLAGVSAYDACYLALAITLGTAVVTADRKLITALERGPYSARVVWVEDLDDGAEP
jgi:predicted nucleic acid-binding protein